MRGPGSRVPPSPWPSCWSQRSPGPAGGVGRARDEEARRRAVRDRGHRPGVRDDPGRGAHDARLLEGLTVLDPATGQPAPGPPPPGPRAPTAGRGRSSCAPPSGPRSSATPSRTRATSRRSDFVGAWLRLVDPNLKSPHALLLDGIPARGSTHAEPPGLGARPDRDRPRRSWAGRGKKTLSGDEVFNFVNDEDREMRRWCGGLPEPAVPDLLKWPQNTPCQSVKYGKAIEALKAQAKKSVAAADEAKAHLGSTGASTPRTTRRSSSRWPGPARGSSRCSRAPRSSRPG